ncbi:uncharacterized protein LOC126678452 [Mercurialis annua]|uniref:uncharacterized protein LOC126678452 n=1 Tax=Mercurialis annua TaxID=3986 RepID=UPI00215F8F7F|nr:uncharacterized protein LOC126678452 [Mercurialis annua]XP_050229309.1 uncharacterized protein LOC126678452 [Mercurialis annua]
MREYARDEYEDYDEYEEEYEQDEYGEAEDEYEEEEEEKERKPSAEELEYLELRARLKEQYRKKLQRENGTAASRSQELKKKVPLDKFGSFFGPSQPVIAQRVIQESKSLLENPHLAFKALNPQKEKVSSSNGTGPKNGVNERVHKIRNEMKTKVEKLKNTRDYSFLLSDDAELPAPSKQPVPRNINVPKSEARPAHVPQKSRQLSGNSVRDIVGGREERKSVPMNGQMHSKSGPCRPTSMNKTISRPMDSRRQPGSNSGIGPGRPAGSKGLVPKMPLATVERKAPAPAPKTIMPATRKPLPPPLKPRPSVPRQHVEQKKTLQEPKKNVAMPKRPVESSRHQINKPLKRIPSHALQDNRPKKKPARPFYDDVAADDEEAIQMLRQMLGPKRWNAADDDDDISDMEANFDEIQQEEKKSLKIARKEDEEQLRLIMEEERRERERKMSKKKKLMQR